MKKFISGFISGAILFGVMGAFAISYTANVAGFKVLVNGKEFVSDPPALVVEGKTYLPLRAIGDALGVAVNWNDQMGQAEVGSAPQSFSTDYSRKNPAPINTPQWVDVDNYVEKYTAGIRVSEVIRGDEAWKMIKAENQFNSEPDDGYEYILAKISVTLESVSEDKAIDTDYFDFDCFSSNNEKYEYKSVVIPNKLDTQLFEGGNAVGYIVCHVKKGDTPKIVYGMKYDGSGGIWFALQ